MKTYTIQELCEDPPTDCWNTKYILLSEAMEFKNGTIHNSWQTAPRDKLIEALQFQGAVTKELLIKLEQCREMYKRDCGG